MATPDTSPPTRMDTRQQSVTASGLGTRSPRASSKVLPEQARSHNRSLVLQTLFHGGPMSRADLARATGLTRVTISDLVSALMSDELISELGLRAVSGPGKPATLIDVNRAGHHIIGIDLSGSDRFLGAVMTLDGDIVARAECAHPADRAEVFGTLVELARRLIADAHAPVLGVGIGTPGVVNDRGVVLSAPNLGWAGFELEGALSRELALPVVVANDANAAVLAEYTLGGGGDDLMLVRVGRGIGSGLVVGGQLLRGSQFAAGEIGHVTVGTDGGAQCACGKTGCLEAWLTVPALTARLAKPHTEAEGDEVLRNAGERLGIALAPVLGALDLSEIVLSGPDELLGGVLAQATAETLRNRTLSAFRQGVQVRMTQQGRDIVLRGTAVMVLSARLGVS